MAVKEIIVRHHGGYEETIFYQKPPVDVDKLNIFNTSDGRLFLVVSYPREDSILDFEVIYEVIPGKGYVCIGDGITGIPADYPYNEIYNHRVNLQWNEYNLNGEKVARQEEDDDE